MISFNAMKYRVPVLKRLIPSAKKLYCQLFWPDGVGTVQSNGAIFRLNYKNFVDRQIAFYGDYEDRQLAYLTREMATLGADTFLDIGANIGYYAIIIAKAGLAGEVIAFEPHPENAQRIAENADLNGLGDHVLIHQLAVAATTGELNFQPGPETSTGQSKVTNDGDIVVDSVSIDDFLSFTGRSLGIKIDVEGYELETLKGMARTLAENKCILQIEIYRDNIPLVTDFLADLSYVQTQIIDHDYFFSRSVSS